MKINNSLNLIGWIRYPDDPHDRVWMPWVNDIDWDTISTTKKVHVGNIDNDLFGAPSQVMQTAVIPRNGSRIIEFSWDSEPQPRDPSPGYIAILHFSEIQVFVNLNGEPWYPNAYSPPYLYADATYNSKPVRGSTRYNISINATANSTLPPIINAVELFSVISTSNIGTDSQDGTYIRAM